MLEQVSLRSLAWLSPLEEKIPLLGRSLDLARQLRRLLEEATCLLMLGSCKQDQVIWQETVTLKEAIGADLGLDQESIDDPPFCAAVIIIRGEF